MPGPRAPGATRTNRVLANAEASGMGKSGARRRRSGSQQTLVGGQQLQGKHVTQQEQREEGERCAADPLLQDGTDLIHRKRNWLGHAKVDGECGCFERQDGGSVRAHMISMECRRWAPMSNMCAHVAVLGCRALHGSPLLLAPRLSIIGSNLLHSSPIPHCRQHKSRRRFHPWRTCHGVEWISMDSSWTW